MPVEPFQYHVCIVRAWRETTAQTEEQVWRFTLEIPGTGQRLGFTDAHALMDALRTELQDMQGPDSLSEDA
jgi:hypothetical protein